jgi:hypothetical protein
VKEKRRDSSMLLFEGNSNTFHNPQFSSQTNVKTQTTNSTKSHSILCSCSIILLFLAIATLSFIVVSNLKNNSSENEAWKESLISDASTISSQTLNPEDSPSSTGNAQRFCQIEPKSRWNSTVKKTTKLKLPIERIIVFETITNKCGERETCLMFLRQRQLNFTQNYFNGFMNNLPENFVIASDGTI